MKVTGAPEFHEVAWRAWREAVGHILKRYKVSDLLEITYDVDTKTKIKRAYGSRPAKAISKTTVTASSLRDATAYTYRVRSLGWRVFVCNDAKLNLTEAVLAYREEYIVERGFILQKLEHRV